MHIFVLYIDVYIVCPLPLTNSGTQWQILTDFSRKVGVSKILILKYP